MISVGRSSSLANTLIPKSPFTETVVKNKNVSISDIIEAIIKGDNLYYTDTVDFAKTFDFSKMADFKKLWSIARRNIKYVKDKPGVEVIKSPSATWWSGKADCKSKSLFIGSVLRNAGVDYFYRLVHYGDANNAHVYPVAVIGDQEIILDSVHYNFNEEIRYKYKVDYDPKTGKQFNEVNVSGITINWKTLLAGGVIALAIKKIFF